MMLRRLLYALPVVAILFFAACGDDPAVHQPTTAMLKLSTGGPLNQGTALAGIGISVILPLGVTVKTDTSGAVPSGVVSASGVASPGVFIPVYTPAAGSTPGKLAFVIASISSGFSTGEFATVTCDISTAYNFTASDFTLADFKPVDLKGAAVDGLTANVAVTFQ